MILSPFFNNPSREQDLSLSKSKVREKSSTRIRLIDHKNSSPYNKINRVRRRFQIKDQKILRQKLSEQRRDAFMKSISQRTIKEKYTRENSKPKFILSHSIPSRSSQLELQNQMKMYLFVHIPQQVKLLQPNTRLLIH